jgi:hypothetical protein
MRTIRSVIHNHKKLVHILITFTTTQSLLLLCHHIGSGSVCLLSRDISARCWEDIATLCFHKLHLRLHWLLCRPAVLYTFLCSRGHLIARQHPIRVGSCTRWKTLLQTFHGCNSSLFPAQYFYPRNDDPHSAGIWCLGNTLHPTESALWVCWDSRGPKLGLNLAAYSAN